MSVTVVGLGYAVMKTRTTALQDALATAYPTQRRTRGYRALHVTRIQVGPAFARMEPVHYATLIERLETKQKEQETGR